MINCKKYADEILRALSGDGHLAVISVGHDAASASYIKGKRMDCKRVGLGFTHYEYPDTAQNEDVLSVIDYLNARQDITGIIVQLPLPEHLDAESICNHIAREKDVDGFRPDSPFQPCTPEGIVHILRCELGALSGRHAVIIGRGKLVGRPLAKMLLSEDMTVSVCHSKTLPEDMYRLADSADAVIVAIGKARKIGFACLRDDCVVVDCGVNRDENGKLCGDIGYCNSHRITPVPGGVGLMTRAMLMRHVDKTGRKIYDDL